MSKTCFITAPAGVDLEPLEKILENNSIQPIRPLETSSLGLSISDSISEAIGKADMVIAVLPKDKSLENIFFQIGIAFAKRKPLLLISEAPSVLPVELSSIFYLRSDFTNIEGLEPSISQFIAKSGRRQRPRTVPTSKTEPIGDRARILKELLEEKSRGSEQLEDFVVELFKEAGASVAKEPISRYEGADFAFWLDDLESVTGNPVLAEVKRHLRHRSDILRTTNQVSTYLNRTSGRFALVLYGEGISSETAQSESGSFQILFFRLPDFIDDLERSTLGEVIKSRRNTVIHGGRP